jgi:hypothetical protein
MSEFQSKWLEWTPCRGKDRSPSSTDKTDKCSSVSSVSAQAERSFPPVPAVTSTGLITRITADEGRIWEWLLTRRPDLADSIKAFDEDPVALEAALRVGIEAWKLAYSSTVSALISDASANLIRGRAGGKIPHLSRLPDGALGGICFLHVDGSITRERTIDDLRGSERLRGETKPQTATDRTDRNPLERPRAKAPIYCFKQAHVDGTLPTAPSQLELWLKRRG